MDTTVIGSTETMDFHVLLYKPPIIQKVMSCRLVDGSAASFTIESAEEKNAPTAIPESTKRRTTECKFFRQKVRHD